MFELIKKKTDTSMPMVYVIILNWKGLQDTLECLESVYRLDYPVFKVIVIDNCSSDDSVETIRREYPNVFLIENSENLGFTGGNNVAMKYAMKAGADYVWLLNNDTIIESGSLTKLVDKAESSKDIGMVSPVIHCYLDKGLKQFIGSYVNWRNVQILYPDRKFKIEDGFRYDGANVCLWGTAMLIKKTTIETIGYLKSEYFAYWEDTEYSLRAIRSGLQNAMCYEAKIFHKTPIDSSSLPKGSHYYYYMLRNWLFFGKSYLNSYSGKLSFYRNYASNLISSIGACWQAGEMASFNACLNGAWHGFKNKGGAMTDDDPMPDRLVTVFKIIANNHPFFIADLMDFNISKIFKELCKRYKFRAQKLARNN